MDSPVYTYEEEMILHKICIRASLITFLALRHNILLSLCLLFCVLVLSDLKHLTALLNRNPLLDSSFVFF